MSAARNPAGRRSPARRRLDAARRAAGCACVALFASATALADGDPFAGRWLLDAAQSRYAADAVPQRMQIVIEAVDGGIHYQSTAVAADGRTAVAEYTAGFDGNPVIVTGHAGLHAPVALRRVDERTVEAAYLRGLQTIASSRWLLSPDALTLTMTTTSADRAGLPLVNVAVYRRATEPGAAR